MLFTVPLLRLQRHPYTRFVRVERFKTSNNSNNNYNYELLFSLLVVFLCFLLTVAKINVSTVVLNKFEYRILPGESPSSNLIFP